jgi:hypothetical protein
MLIQQGDVLIMKVKEIPADAVPKPGPVVLAEGETTGHAHRIESDKAQLYTMGNILFLNVLAPVVVKHEEHKPVTVEPGQYRIGRVQEYDHFAEEARAVED